MGLSDTDANLHNPTERRIILHQQWVSNGRHILNLSLNWSNSHRRKIKLWKHSHMFDCQHRIPLLINIQKSFSVQKLIVTVFHLSLKLLELFKIYINMACTKYKSKSQAPIHIREIRMLFGEVKSAIILGPIYPR